jgi:3-oxoacyl-[acyl-carrier protein] reductase
MSKKITLITGTSKGIGRSLTEYYLEAGHHVVGCSRNAIDFTSPNYTHVITDVANEADVKTLFQVIRKKHGKLDHLINNAGIAAMNHALLTPLNTVTRVLNTNVTGTFLISREAAKLMSKNKFGRIINFTTVATPLKLKGEAIYAASKAAVISLTQILAGEFAEYGITVNAIGPTPIDTDLTRSIPQHKLDELIQYQAIKRFGTTDDVINVVDFFLQETSQFITGQTLYLGGIS